MDVDGEEILNYRIVPCNGVKLCSRSSDGCNFVLAVKMRWCPDHPEEKLVHSNPCPVEIVYFWPEDMADNRQWITGYICAGGDVNAQNLHNHPLSSQSKIPSSC